MKWYAVILHDSSWNVVHTDVITEENNLSFNDRYSFVKFDKRWTVIFECVSDLQGIRVLQDYKSGKRIG